MTYIKMHKLLMLDEKLGKKASVILNMFVCDSGIKLFMQSKIALGTYYLNCQNSNPFFDFQDRFNQFFFSQIMA